MKRQGSFSMTAFLSTPSARRATNIMMRAEQIWDISIHALREEGDYLKTLTLKP